MYKNMSVIMTKAVIATCLIIQKFCRMCYVDHFQICLSCHSFLDWVVSSALVEGHWLLLCSTWETAVPLSCYWGTSSHNPGVVSPSFTKHSLQKHHLQRGRLHEETQANAYLMPRRGFTCIWTLTLQHPGSDWQREESTKKEGCCMSSSSFRT